MTQNTSNAVMATRVEPADSLDDFPTPPWGTRALCEHVIHDRVGCASVLEPAVNRGHMIRPLEEYFSAVYASDIHDYGYGFRVRDFLEPVGSRCDWVITNPPFKLAEAFIARALVRAHIGIAMLVRAQFLESVGRYERLFSKNPPSIIAQFSERLPMVKGRYDPKASTATAYCWLVWVQGETETRYMWIPPCRKDLERETDDLVL